MFYSMTGSAEILAQLKLCIYFLIMNNSAYQDLLTEIHVVSDKTHDMIETFVTPHQYCSTKQVSNADFLLRGMGTLIFLPFLQRVSLCNFLFGFLGNSGLSYFRGVSVLQIRRVFVDNSEIVFVFVSREKYVLTLHPNRLGETVLIRGHNITFNGDYGKLQLYCPYYSLSRAPGLLIRKKLASVEIGGKADNGVVTCPGSVGIQLIKSYL